MAREVVAKFGSFELLHDDSTGLLGALMYTFDVRGENEFAKLHIGDVGNMRIRVKDGVWDSVAEAERAQKQFAEAIEAAKIFKAKVDEINGVFDPETEAEPAGESQEQE